MASTVSLVAFSTRRARVGAIANVRLDYLQPPYEARKDVETNHLTFVPDTTNDVLRTYSKWQFMQAFSNDQPQPWLDAAPRPDPEYERGTRLLSRILKVAHPGKLTLKQLERLATDAERMAEGARQALLLRLLREGAALPDGLLPGHVNFTAVTAAEVRRKQPRDRQSKASVR